MIDPLIPRPGRYHAAGRDTERQAAESVTQSTGRLRQRVLTLLFDAGHYGLTDDEGGVAMGADRLTFGRRRQELCMSGHVIDSGRRRPTPTGRSAIVWIINPLDWPQ